MSLRPLASSAVDLRTAPTTRFPGRIPGLDGMRAISFLIVFLSHLGFMHSRPGGFAVTVFFALSGFLITTLLIREHQATGTISLRAFYLRRTFRIFPAMYATLALCMVLTLLHWLPGTLRTHDILAEFAYLQNYWTWASEKWGQLGCVPGTIPFWSLCVEEHFYLLFPLAFLLMLRRRFTPARMARWLLGACAAVLVWRFFALHIFYQGDQYCYRASDTRIDAILWGCLLAVLEQMPRLRAWIHQGRRLGALTLAGLAVIAASFTLHGTTLHHTIVLTLQSACLLPLLLFITHRPEARTVRFLDHPVLVHLGVLSYVLYLVHDAAIELVLSHVHATSRLVIWPLAAALAYALALGMHWAVEQPFARLRSRYRPAAERRMVESPLLEEQETGANLRSAPNRVTA